MNHISPLALFNILQHIPKKHKQMAIDILLGVEAQVESLFSVPKTGTMDIYTVEQGENKLTMIDYRWLGKVELGFRHKQTVKTIWLS